MPAAFHEAVAHQRGIARGLNLAGRVVDFGGERAGPRTLKPRPMSSSKCASSRTHSLFEMPAPRATATISVAWLVAVACLPLI